MTSPILILGLLLTFQTATPDPSPASRLAAAEAAHDTPSAISVLAQLTDTLPAAPLPTLQASIPAIAHAVSNPDAHIRSLALLALIALTNRTHPDGTPSADALPLLEPYLPEITRHLNDPNPPIRQLTALFLGGFLADPSPAVIAPLLSALAFPAAPTPFDLSVIVALLTLNVGSPRDPDIPKHILTFLLRPDAPPDLTLRILNAIASHPRHSMVLDTGLLVFLSRPHPPLIRAGVIGILPHLALEQTDLQATQARLRRIIADPSEDAAIKSRAAEVLSCWHSARMFDPCPVPPIRYRRLPNLPQPPAAAPGSLSPPRY